MRFSPFLCEEGEEQSAVESALLFIFGIDDTNNLTHDDLRVEGGALCAGVDDTYPVSPPKWFTPLSKI